MKPITHEQQVRNLRDRVEELRGEFFEEVWAGDKRFMYCRACSAMWKDGDMEQHCGNCVAIPFGTYFDTLILKVAQGDEDAE